MKKIVLILMMACGWLYGQEAEVKPVSALEGDELEMYNLLKQAIIAHVQDTVPLHFFPEVSFKTVDKKLIVQTLYYHQPNEDYSYQQSIIRSVTFSGQLTFTKTFVPDPNQSYAGFGTGGGTETVTFDPSPVPKVEVYQLLVYKPRYPQMSKRSYGKALVKLQSDSAFFNGKYNYRVEFNSWPSPNRTDKQYYRPESTADGEHRLVYTYCSKAFAIARSNKRYGIVDAQNRVIVPLEHQYISVHHQGLLIKKDSKAWFYDPMSRKVTSKKYDKIKPGFLATVSGQLKDYSLVTNNGMVSVLDSNNKEILPFDYTKITILSYRNLTTLLAEKDRKKVLIDIDTHKEISVLYDSLELLHHNLILVQYQGLFGFIDNQNQSLLDIEYDSITNLDISYNTYKVQKGNKTALYNYETKNMVTDFQYSDIATIGKLYMVSKGKKTGAVNSAGKLIIPVKYHKIDFKRSNKTYEAVGKRRRDTYLENGARVVE